MAAFSSPALIEASFVSRLVTRKTVMAGLLILVIVAALAILAPLIAPYSPSRLSVVNRLKPRKSSSRARTLSNASSAAWWARSSNSGPVIDPS